MTELQTGLIGLGAFAVVGVVAYNKWQEYRHRKLAEQVLNVRHKDVLLEEANTESVLESRAPESDAVFTQEAGMEETSPAVPSSFSERVEPVLRLDPADAERNEPSIHQPDELTDSSDAPESVVETEVVPVPEPEPEPEFAPEPPLPEALPDPVQVPVYQETKLAKEGNEPKDVRDAKLVSEPFSLLSPAVDYVVSFETVEPAPAYQILEAQQKLQPHIRKPVQWVGYNEYAHEWEPIVDNGGNAYRHLRIGLQLVDRQGPVSEGALSAFIAAMQDLADELMAIVDLPPRQAALVNAAKLDAFCASVDIQIGINVISQGQAFPGTKLRGLAEAAGMVIVAEGFFVRCDDDGNVLYTLLNQEAAGFSAESMKTMSTHGVTFLLDVPRVAHGDRVFNQMVDLARRFAEVLHGALVDDNRRPLSEGALEPIRRQVVQYQSTMAAQGLPAGHPLTRRLFS